MNPFPGSFLFLRRRNEWEAADSGLLLWRNSFAQFIPFYAVPIVLAAVALRFLFSEQVHFSYLVLWWLKPFFDRFALHVIATRFFGDPPPSRFRDLCKGIGRIWRGIVGDLLWRRFSPVRAARMPIRMLERVGRSQYYTRKENLAAGGLNACFRVSFLCLVLEVFLLCGELMFSIMLMILLFPSLFGSVWNILVAYEIVIFAAFCGNYILVGSIYVCMGFGLYINSRVEVEGWDLQLLFQKFAAAAKASAFCIFFALFLAMPQTAFSQQQEPVPFFPSDFPTASAEYLEGLDTILSSGDFGGTKQGWEIHLKKEIKFPEIKLPSLRLREREPINKEAIAVVLRVVIVAVIVGFAAFVLHWCWKHRQTLGIRFKEKGMMGKGAMHINPFFSPGTPESLFAQAEELFGMGKLREAWAACLAGCIRSYTRFVSFPADATEYGCLELVRKALPNEAKHFGELVQSWILLAYGGRLPGEGTFEKALAYGRSLLVRQENANGT
jgi:hypothetical protein